MRKLKLLFLAGVATMTAAAQNNEIKSITEGYRQHIPVFEDSSEKDMLLKPDFSNEELFRLYYGAGAPGNVAAALKKMTDFAGSVSIAGTSKPKELKRFYKSVHQAFFVRYVDNPLFKEIFENGNYNCVTASAIYALLLQQFSVSYDIRETPTHVYIVANPGASNVILETTAPGMKTMQFTEAGKTKFLEYLVNNKLITAAEATGPEKEQLFEKYFFGDEKIDLKQLGGLLYYNIGVEAGQKEDYLKGYKNLEKAYMLYPSKKIAYLTANMLGAYLAGKDLADEEKRWPYYLRLLELNNTGLTRDFFKDYCYSAIKNYLFEKSDPGKISYLFANVNAYSNDTALLNEINYEYYYSAGRYYDIKGKFDSSLAFLDAAYKLKPGNLLLQELISTLVIRRTVTNGDFSGGKPMDALDSFVSRFPFLKENKQISVLYAYSLAYNTYNSFQEKNKEQADQYLDKIYALLDTDLNAVKVNEEAFNNAFRAVYSYYVGNRKISEARVFLERVKKYLPENREINKRLEYLNDKIY